MHKLVATGRRGRRYACRGQVASGAGGGVRIGMVEGVERGAPVDFEPEGHVGARVEDRDRDLLERLLLKREISILSAVRWASRGGW